LCWYVFCFYFTLNKKELLSKTQPDGAFFCAQQGPISNMPSSSGVGLLYGAAAGDFKFDAGKNSFDLVSFDAATRLIYSTHLTSEIALIGTFLGGGSIATTVIMNGEEASTYSPTGFNGLSSLRMVAIGSGERPQFILDNLTLNIEPNSSIADVAAPGTGAILSMLALGAFSSRRRRSLSGQ
jgi:MYXO-CTERM domain-containing protein